jgi:chromate transport protein ChrA
MKILTVDVYQWLSFPELIHLYSVGQMAPGPNMMLIMAMGEWIVELRAPFSLSSRCLCRPPS